MNISEMIRNIVGGTDPNAAMNAQAAMPGGGQQAAPPPTAAPPQQPKALESPADLRNMYITLMERNRNAQQLDSGLSLIAAGLSNSPANRVALINSAGQGGGSGGMSLSANDMLNFQKQEQAQRDALIRKQALPALMKQYKMSPAQIQYLEAGGQLDEVVKHYSTENLGTAEDKGTGQKILFNQRTGQEITRLGGVEPETGEYVDTPEGKRLMSKRIDPAAPAAPVGLSPTDMKQQYDEFNAVLVGQGKPPMSPAEFFKMKQSPGVTVNTGKGADLPFQPPEKGYEYERDVDGKIIVDPVTRRPTQYKIPGAGPEEESTLKATELAKKTANETKAETRKRAAAALTASSVGKAVDSAFDVVDKPGATGFGSKLARSVDVFGGTPMSDMDSALSTINANTAFAQLAQMREAAASGASGLGQVTERENIMLQSVIADLRAHQGTAKVKEKLARVKAAMVLMASEDFSKTNDKGEPVFDIARFNKELDTATNEEIKEQYNRKNKTNVKIKKVE